MRAFVVASVLAISAATAYAPQPTVVNGNSKVTYAGFERNGVELFLNIKYGMDTGGENRFKPPRPFKPEPGSSHDATKAGPACPQLLGTWNQPLTLNNITEISEDCLNLNVARPKGMGDRKLPVMVWIHGGSFWVGSNMEPTHTPDGLIRESVENGLPVIHVAMNYRLGVFGFAQSEALRKEGSLNAGLKDQRLAIEWVRENIGAFGGDSGNITIFGQSSGGLAVGLQLLAYGGAKPLPFQRGICESQALEPGITGNFTIDAMAELVRYTPCANLPLHSEETIECLRAASTETTLNASLTSYVGDIKHNIGDIWLPVVDGDFLPAPPSQLVKEGRFGNATYMIGWTDGDVNFFTDISIATSNDTLAFIQGYLPAMPAEAVNRLLGLYPVAEFTPPSGTNLTAEFYRAARVFRDIIMVCQPMFLAESIYNRSNMTNTPQNKVYLYDFNQTILEPILEQVYDVSHLGVVHTSEFAYIYGNLSIYNVSGFAFNPTVKDYELVKRASRSWSTFASTGSPSMEGKYTLQGFGPAYSRLGDIASLYIVGGPFQSFSKVAGSMSAEVLEEQKLRRRCAVINSEEFIGYLQY